MDSFCGSTPRAGSLMAVCVYELRCWVALYQVTVHTLMFVDECNGVSLRIILKAELGLDFKLN